jgi:protein TonB
VTASRSGTRLAGWGLAAAAACGLIGAAAAFALVTERRASVVVLDLAALPPAAAEIAAVAEAAPVVAAAAPALPAPPQMAEPATIVPDASSRPMPVAAARLALPEIEPGVAADVSLPPPAPARDQAAMSSPRPKARPDRQAEGKPEPKPRQPAEAPAEPRQERPLAEAPAVAPSPGAMARGGGPSPEAYAKAVLKKVRATKRRAGAGKGTVVVGFSIAANGALARVQVLRSSGIPALDDVALDHIRRSAPFPPRPPDARGGYSFEFVGR